MTEKIASERAPYVEQQDLLTARQQELEPFLCDLAEKGKEAFRLLRPLAQDARFVDKESRFRYLRDGGVCATELDEQGAENLYVSFGSGHNLTVSRDAHDENSCAWEFIRNRELPGIGIQQTLVKEAVLKRSNYDGGRMSIEVGLYELPSSDDDRGKYIEGVCDFTNNLAQAEMYIAMMACDLTVAVEFNTTQ